MFASENPTEITVRMQSSHEILSFNIEASKEGGPFNKGPAGSFVLFLEVAVLEIKVLTFNIHHGRGTDRKVDLGRIASVIEKSGADVVGLNEVDVCYSKRSGFLNQVDWLSETLDMNKLFGATMTLGAWNNTFLRQYGNALLSRYPIVFEANSLFRPHRSVFEKRGLLEANVDVHGQLIKIFVTHLSLGPVLKNRQIGFLLGKLGETRLPVILMGDFNMKPGSRPWKKITGTLTDVCHFAFSAPCNTFPSYQPKVQLDYIFVSSHFCIGPVRFLKQWDTASDHLPIRATLHLKRTLETER